MLIQFGIEKKEWMNIETENSSDRNSIDCDKRQATITVTATSVNTVLSTTTTTTTTKTAIRSIIINTWCIIYIFLFM